MSEATEGALRERVGEMRRRIAVLRNEVGKAVLGQRDLVDQLLLAVVAGGHVLLEGLPGLGKTLLVKSLARSLGLAFSRIQFTPDLMPADITGTRVIEERQGERAFRFQPGPIFTNLLLADEINRATPKTQSALLEAMQEYSVTVGTTTHRLRQPFSVVATQNPIELEGTYPLPEAQLDRFLFKLEVTLPGEDDLVAVLEATTGDQHPELTAVLTGEELVELQQTARQILCGEHLVRYVAALVRASHPTADADPTTRRLVRFGASPRAGQAIILAGKARALLDGRPCVAKEDLLAVMLPAVRHRVVLSFEAEAEGTGIAELLAGWQVRAERHG
ncbi:MAG: AAA family ATPase [Planctomycetes bacterium]|nr:AAA family ATPase [Planctomycetota bacterium]MCB9870580.1 AAA family ATPase [Planctomycetota bacterium]